MTRARERLFMTCAVPDPEKKLAKLRPAAEPVMPAETLAAMRCPADWLISAALGTGCRKLTLSTGADGLGLPLPLHENARPRTEPETGPKEESGCINNIDLHASLDWAYPFKNAQLLPSKLTATELKSLAEPDPESAELLRRRPRPFRKPDIRGLDRALTAAEKGTAAHLALRYLELGGLSSPEDVRGRLQALVEQGRISAREAASVDAVSILRLAQSELGRKIAAAPRLLREFPFALLCPAGRFFEGAEGEELLLQGVVDCCIIEDDGLTVIDYKTDRIRPGQEPQRAELYRSQLEAYSWAMSRITGLPVKDRYLLFLATGTALAL